MEILGLVIALLLIAYFSGIEIAFVSANKLRVELLKEKGSGAAKIISDFNHNPSRFISTMLIGLNIGLVAFGSIAANVFTPENFGLQPMREVTVLIIQTIITTFIILIFGELLPKILFRVNADQTLLLFAYPTKYLFYYPLAPLSQIFHSLSRAIIKLVFGAELVENKQSFTKEDLEYLVKETAATTEDLDGEETDHLNSEIFEKALYLKDVKVRNCMVPRMEIVGMDVTEDVGQMHRQFIDSKHSRIMVYENSIDNIVGYVHHFDVLKSPANLRSVLRTIQAIPGTMTARDLLLQFIRERKNIAWVVDEYGGTAGIITLEDLMEQIFGEIKDEHDEESLTEKKIGDNEFILSGRLEVDYLNSEYELDIPEGEYSTLSGYVVSNFEDIPEAGTTIDMDHFTVKIMRSTDKRIELVNLKIKKEPV